MTTQLVDCTLVHIGWVKCSISIALPAINFAHHAFLSPEKNFVVLMTRSTTFYLYPTAETSSDMKDQCVVIQVTMSHNRHLHLHAFA